MHTFAVLVEAEEGGFRAWCPALRQLGAEAKEESQAEALLRLHDVLQVLLYGMRQAGTPLPEPSDETYDGVRATITVIEEHDEWTVDQVAGLGLPTAAGVGSAKIKKKR